MRKKNKQMLGIGIVAILFAVPLGYWITYETTPGNLDGFAACLADEGATFYGAFWCPHCDNQKSMFGKSSDLLPYVECSTANREMNQTCRDANIQSYPTWEFADESRLTGVVSLERLSEKTGCALPGDEDETATSTPQETNEDTSTTTPVD